MTDSTGNSKSDRERQKALEWMKTKWVGSKACPICTNDEWNVSDVQELRPYNDGDLRVGDVTIVPIFLVTCKNCGLAHTFAATVAGVIAPD